MAVFVVPFIPLILAGAGIIGGTVAGREIAKNNAAEKNKAREDLASRVNDLKATVEAHAAKGEYAQAIKSLLELNALYKENYTLTPDQTTQLDKLLQSMIFTSQEKAREIEREFKKEWQSFDNYDPLDLRFEHKLYIDKLKVVLPEDDAFLQRQIAKFDRNEPPFGGTSYLSSQG